MSRFCESILEGFNFISVDAAEKDDRNGERCQFRNREREPEGVERETLWLSFPIAELASLAIAVVLFRGVYRHEIKPLEE